MLTRIFSPYHRPKMSKWNRLDKWLPYKFTFVFIFCLNSYRYVYAYIRLRPELGRQKDSPPTPRSSRYDLLVGFFHFSDWALESQNILIYTCDIIVYIFFFWMSSAASQHMWISWRYVNGFRLPCGIRFQKVQNYYRGIKKNIGFGKLKLFQKHQGCDHKIKNNTFFLQKPCN